MAITTLDGVLSALGNNSSRIVIDKSSIANLVAGQNYSLWRATGQPAQAAIPGTTPAIPTSATTGAMGFTNQTAPAASYVAQMSLLSSNSAMSLELHDRVAHVGGLVLNVTTAQTINGATGIDLGAAGLNVPADRIGDANYSDIQWWLEVYSDGGATASNATVSVTYGDNTTANLNVIAVGGTLRAGRMIALTPFIATTEQGKFIRRINSVTLSASTGTAGNFGFTATRRRCDFDLPLANMVARFDWASMGFPSVPNDACLTLIGTTSTTSSGTLRGGGKIAHG